MSKQRELYLAIPHDAYKQFFLLPFTQLALERHQVNLLVFHPEREEIILWKK